MEKIFACVFYVFRELGFGVWADTLYPLEPGRKWRKSEEARNSESKRRRNYGFTELPPSLPLPGSDPVTRICRIQFKVTAGSLACDLIVEAA